MTLHTTGHITGNTPHETLTDAAPENHTAEKGFAEALSTTSRKRPASDDGTTAPAAKQPRIQKTRDDYLTDMGMSAPSRIKNGEKTKGKTLRKLAEQNSDIRNNTLYPAPTQYLTQIHPSNCIQKCDPLKAGDHSPSISAVNRTQEPEFTITGRTTKPRPGNTEIDEKHVPTLQFHTPEFDNNGKHDTAKSSAAHTLLTTAREMHGAGEKAVHETGDDLRDTTFHAYSPYDSHGNPTQDGIKMPRVHVYSEHGGPASRLNHSPNGVSPMIGQGIINLSYATTKAGTEPDGLEGLQMKTKTPKA